MTLLVLRYSHPAIGNGGNSIEMLGAHLEHVAASYANVLPGDPLPDGRPAVCLCFDQPTPAFGRQILPLLEKYALRALVAIAPGAIRSELGPGPDRAANCTWSYLRDLVRTKRIAVAANGYTGRPLGASSEWDTEIHVPRTVLAAQLQVPIDGFVFPHGSVTRAALKTVKAGYRYAFTDRNAGNAGWDQPLLYRIGGDNLRTPTDPFDPLRVTQYRVRSLLHRIVT